jgi:hypothetical protein
MLFRHDVAAFHRFILGDVGQDRVAVLVLALFVLAFVVEGEEAVELHDRAGGAELHVLVAARDIDRHLVEHGTFHLARHGALPDQLVEAELVLVQVRSHVLRRAEEVGRPDRLVRFLGVLGLGRINARARRHVALTVLGLDQATCLANRLGRKLHAVGAHVGDEAHGLAADVDTFIQALRDAHRGRGADAQLARGLLLQGRGDERRRRVATHLAAVDRGHRKGAAFDLSLGRLRALLVVEVELLELAAIEMGEAGLQGLLLGGAEDGIDRPVFAGLEDLDLGFALADQAQRHRLHAAGRAAARQLAPQHRRQGEAHEIVERAAGHVGVDQRLVEVARMGDGVQHRLLGDGIESDALYLDAGQRLLAAQDVEHVPRDGFALAIRIGREIELAALGDGFGNGVEALLRLGVDLPVHGEIFVRADRTILGRQIADMTIGGQHGEAGAEILSNGLSLGRGLDDQHVHRRNMLQ